MEQFNMNTSSSELMDDSKWRGGIFTNGWRKGKETVEVNDASGNLLGVIGVGGHQEVAEAAKSARAAQIAWHHTSHGQKAEVFRRAADLMREKFQELSSWLVRESGSTQGKAKFELSIAIRVLEDAGAMPAQASGLVLPSTGTRLSFCRRVPLGVIGIISPFNFPLYLAVRAVAPAIATGNAVVLKPDIRTSIWADIAIDEHSMW
jgi:benzaldehyde dehydrogenase (NAD)